MTQIRIHTEQVREIGRQFRAKSEQLNDIDNALQSAIGNLDTWAWDGRSRADAEPMLDQVRPESDRIAQEMDRLGQLLERVADRFENEDNNAAQSIGDMDWVDWTIEHGDITNKIPESPPDTTDQNNETSNDTSNEDGLLTWDDILGLGLAFGEGGKELLKVITSVSAASSISGLSANWLKNVGVLGVKNFQRGWRDLFSKPVKGIPLISTVIEVGQEIGENWTEYDKDISKVAIGVAFDTWLGVGGTVVGAAVGTALFGALGTAIAGPAGTVIGGKIGGIIGGWAGGELAEWVEDWKIGGKELDQTVVEAVSGVTEKVGEAIGEGLYNAVEGIVSFFD